ncbi:uncharacterized protein K444DRAFT_519277 [Hyaloscypha bicolor E]|uniref:GED domain-containing protein n=1 Tax=Hyaloscypha bicolor E TaxID=1095630 RepID=A0A2J6TR04_9HELO|nr:uncharacterized protein K444DRAFT_519277 [Hyaloscypha bicolor E]PMD65465.1 hypothetical protein K444DRAFT_519277 [Hyaloscypha bicolor E]
MAEEPAQTQGLELVGQKVKILVDAISELRNFGLDHVVQLPELVLVGDQSAGKSSLMSALTEVQLPKDQGICTKCPANIKTSPSDTWTCQVSLQQYYKYISPGPRGVESRHVTKARPFPPWVEQVLEVKKFKTITNKSELEEVIKWAQIALLNHDEDYRIFIPGTGRRALGDFQQERESTEAKFSPNVIFIEISGPGLPALSFYDLPGIFRVAPDPKDQYLAKVIENLAVKYIDRPNALIIWTLAMKTDPSNSSTGKVIQDCKATSRCVGVLTNPDHVSIRHLEYEKILLGKAHIVRHGYYVTKQPAENSNLHGPNYHALARQEETEFFDTHELWTQDWASFRNRCGTSAIQEFLSTQLATQILYSIPNITEKVQQRTRDVDQQLSDCPDLPESDMLNIVTRLLAQVSNDVQNLVNGDLYDLPTSFQNEWTTLCDRFRDLILHIKPKVTVSHESDHAEVIELISDDDEPFRPSTPIRKRPAEQVQSPPAQRQRTSQSPHSQYRVIQTPPTGIKRENGLMQAPPLRLPASNRNQFAGTPFQSVENLGKGFTNLTEISKTILSNTRPGLPGLVNIKTYNDLCLQSVASWKFPLEIFINETLRMLRQQLENILKKRLGVYEQTQLYRTAGTYLQKFLDGHMEEQRKCLKELFELETYRSFTINRAAILENNTNELRNLQQIRRSVRARAFVEKQIRLGQKKRLTDMTMEERSKEMNKRAAEIRDEQLGPDPFKLELEVAAYVRGYYMTAALRFVDSVCLSVHGKLFRSISQSIFYYLETQLGIAGSLDGEEVCRNLMEEDATTGRKRRELKQEKHRLTAFSERLARLVEQIREGDNSEHGQSEPATYSNYTGDGMPDVPEVEDDDDVMIVDDGSRL